MTMKSSEFKPHKAKGAVFLDRDGTINEDIGWLYEPGKLKFIEGAFDALLALQEKYGLYIITNQSGISEGVFTGEQYLKFSEYYLKQLNRAGIRIGGMYHCPHSKNDGCACRKPSPYFIEKICREKNLSAEESYVIGDHPHDVETAKNAGAKGIYVLTGHGAKHLHENKIRPDFTASSIVQAAGHILKNSR